MKFPVKLGRIEALDYLRGYFVMIIIVDHLYRWPSFLSILTGQGSLWSNASDGFLIISGLLVGYIRGYKVRDQPFPQVARKLGLRALQLYIWGVGISLLLVAIQWFVPFKAAMPNIDPATGDWIGLISSILTGIYAHPWIYFLHLYAIYMLLAVGAVWLLRRRLWWVVIILSVVSMLLGQLEYGEWLERLPLFFIPATAGYYLDKIRLRITQLQAPQQQRLYIAVIGLFIVTVAISAIWRFFPTLFTPALHASLNTTFDRLPMSFGATITGFVWFIGLFAFFNRFLPFVQKYIGWLLLPFGRRSLAAYILHCVPLLITSYFFVMNDNLWLNSLLGVISVLSVWAMIRTPLAHRLLPH